MPIIFKNESEIHLQYTDCSKVIKITLKNNECWKVESRKKWVNISTEFTFLYTVSLFYNVYKAKN